MAYLILLSLCVCFITGFPVLIAQQWEAYRSTGRPERTGNLSAFITLVSVLIIIVAVFTAALIKLFVIGL